MALLNTTRSWGWPAKALHWAIAVLVAVQLGVGLAMVWLVTDLGRRFELYQLHKSLGVLVLTLVVVRLGWRCANPILPTLPAGLSVLERRLAGLTHRGLYLLLFLLPLTGWIMASASPLGIPTIVFGLFRLPDAVGPNANLEDLMKVAHGLLAVLLLLLTGLHVAAAVKHHFVLRDEVLLRMLPGR